MSNTFEASRDVGRALVRSMEALDARMDRLERHMDRLEDALHARMDRVDRRFAWSLGLQVTTAIAVVAALVVR